MNNGMPAVKIVWHPNVEGQPGSHFFVQYRRKGETLFAKSDDEFDENFLILRGLEPNQLYEIRAVVVDGDFFTESDVEEVEMYAGEWGSRGSKSSGPSDSSDWSPCRQTGRTSRARRRWRPPAGSSA